MRAFQSAGSADLLNFGGASVSLMPSAKLTVPSRLPVYDGEKMRPVYSLVYSLIVGLREFVSIFV